MTTRQEAQCATFKPLYGGKQVSDRLYQLALNQQAVSEQYGNQARQECSAEDAIAIISDYARLFLENEQTKDRWVELEDQLAFTKNEVQSLHGKVGAAKRKNNTLEVKVKEQSNIIDDQLDTIVELTNQLDQRDVQ